jgi:hypothetical protein
MACKHCGHAKKWHGEMPLLAALGLTPRHLPKKVSPTLSALTLHCAAVKRPSAGCLTVSEKDLQIIRLALAARSKAKAARWAKLRRTPGSALNTAMVLTQAACVTGTRARTMIESFSIPTLSHWCACPGYAERRK